MPEASARSPAEAAIPVAGAAPAAPVGPAGEDATLGDLQSWMLEAIVTGAAPAAAVRARIGGDAQLGAEARLAIYAGGYRSRLGQTLRQDYPALLLLAGETVFDLFVRSYLAARPPRHFSLYDYGAGFADHLEATRPTDGGGPLAALPAAVARLERARAEVQRAEGLERRSAPLLAADAAMLPGLRLQLPDSVRLLALDFDLAPLIEAADDGAKPVVPEVRESRVAVARSGWRVALHALAPWQYDWLQALGAEGAEIHAAAASAARSSGRDCGALLADLALWLPAAAAVGLVTAA